MVEPQAPPLSKAARRRARQRLQMNPFTAPPPGAAKGKGKGKGANTPYKKDQDGLYVTDGQSKQVCFNFAKNGACSEPCPHSRVHVCQFCLGPHPNCGKKK